MGGELAPVLTGGGVLGILAILVIYLLIQNRADRARYDELVANADRRTDEWIQRVRELQTRLDAERAARRAAEDATAAQAREVRRLGDRVAELSAEVEKLRHQLGGVG